MKNQETISQFIHCLLCVAILTSCGQRKKLAKKDYEWMPYKGNESLIFKSNVGEIDTIFFLKKETYWHYPYPAVSSNEYQEVAIFCRHSDPNMPKGKNRYLEGPFFEIKKNMNNEAELKILLVAKDAVFYRHTPIKIDSMENVKPVTLQTDYGKYSDVYVINGEDYLGTFYQRSNFVTKLYWSKSRGLVRYDKKGAIYWELSL